MEHLRGALGVSYLVGIIASSHAFVVKDMTYHRHNHPVHHVVSSSSLQESPLPLHLSTTSSLSATPRPILLPKPPQHLQEAIRSAALSLWGPTELERITTCSSSSSKQQRLEGEASFHKTGNEERPLYSDRQRIWGDQAWQGNACAQHSLGLLLWNGYGSKGGGNKEVESARWHAAAATQNHVDAICLLGACLRTGTGVGQQDTLGRDLIAYAASVNNPTGINKQVALVLEDEEEANTDQRTSPLELYLQCPNPNALLLMNLGWIHVIEPKQALGNKRSQNDNKEKTDHDRILLREQGLDYWRQAVALAPDEGSEEAAWFLYRHFVKEDDHDPEQVQSWLSIAAELGYPEAIDELQKDGFQPLTGSGYSF